MPGYVDKVCLRFKHELPQKPQHSPYKAAPKVYGVAAQNTIPDNESPKLDEERRKVVQQVIGSVPYYEQAVNETTLPALSSLASKQAQATESTEKKFWELLDYLATHPDATVWYYASSMILNIHSDASYLSESRARSRVAGYFFLGNMPTDRKPIRINSAIYAMCGILKFVITSTAEAELGALFLNCKEGNIMIDVGGNWTPTTSHTSTR